ncbi:hypothetical protein DSUL_20523 [Desulfovibrionales bacterium]
MGQLLYSFVVYAEGGRQGRQLQIWSDSQGGRLKNQLFWVTGRYGHIRWQRRN